MRTDYKRSTSGTYEASNSAFPTQGTATATERREYSVDRSETPTGMDSAQRDQYERMSPEGKEYVDRQMEAYDAICEGSSEC